MYDNVIRDDIVIYSSCIAMYDAYVSMLILEHTSIHCDYFIISVYAIL